MVLAFAHYYFISLLYERFTETEGDEVYGSRGSGSENDFLGAHVQICRHRFARTFIFLRGDGRYMMHGPVDICTVFFRKFDPFRDYAAGPQRGCGVVKIDERLSIYLFVQLGKILP